MVQPAAAGGEKLGVDAVPTYRLHQFDLHLAEIPERDRDGRVSRSTAMTRRRAQLDVLHALEILDAHAALEPGLGREQIRHDVRHLEEVRRQALDHGRTTTLTTPLVLSFANRKPSAISSKDTTWLTSSCAGRMPAAIQSRHNW